MGLLQNAKSFQRKSNQKNDLSRIRLEKRIVSAPAHTHESHHCRQIFTSRQSWRPLMMPLCRHEQAKNLTSRQSWWPQSWPDLFHTCCHGQAKSPNQPSELGKYVVVAQFLGLLEAHDLKLEEGEVHVVVLVKPDVSVPNGGVLDPRVVVGKQDLDNKIKYATV